MYDLQVISFHSWVVFALFIISSDALVFNCDEIQLIFLLLLCLSFFDYPPPSLASLTSLPGVSLSSLAASLQVSTAGSFDSLGFSARSFPKGCHPCICRCRPEGAGADDWGRSGALCPAASRPDDWDWWGFWSGEEGRIQGSCWSQPHPIYHTLKTEWFLLWALWRDDSPRERGRDKEFYKEEGATRVQRALAPQH